jgi:hypothetical protein
VTILEIFISPRHPKFLSASPWGDASPTLGSAALDYDDFDEMIKAVNSVRIVYIAENWKLSTCTCIWWLKNISNHVIAMMSHRLELHKFDDRAVALPITQNIKRGRPPNTQSTRNKQPNEIQGEAAEESD